MLTKPTWSILSQTFREWSEDKVPRLGAALAYYSVFSIAPLLLVVIAIAGLVFGREAAQHEFLIGLYLAHSSVTSIYGAAGSLVVILLWVYYSSQILLLGAEFTQVYANQYGSAIRPKSNAIALEDGTGSRTAQVGNVGEGQDGESPRRDELLPQRGSVQ